MHAYVTDYHCEICDRRGCRRSTETNNRDYKMLAHAVDLNFFVSRKHGQNIIDQDFPFVQPGRLVFFLAQVYADTHGSHDTGHVVPVDCALLSPPRSMRVDGLSPESQRDKCCDYLRSAL